jgi:MFS family permease
MQTNRSNIGALIGGALLIGFGLLSLVSRVFTGFNWGWVWPFLIIGFGVLFFIAMFATGKNAAALAIPGSIISGIGLVLLFQNITQHWESMSYFWTLIILFVGLGIYIMGWYGEDEGQRRSGAKLIRVGFILFVIFGAFFEMIFSSFNNLIFPILLIVLGVYLVLARSGLFKRHEISNDKPVPPAS